MVPLTSLTLTRGLPGSGKTTYAKKWVAQDPAERVRFNRDDLRRMIYGRAAGLDWEQEKTITEVQRAATATALKAGRKVILDDTNLRLRFAREWATMAAELGAEFEVVDFDTSVDMCVARDRNRFLDGGRHVGEEVIRDMDKRFRDRPEVLPKEKAAREVPDWYYPDTSQPDAWIFDIDGTLAHARTRDIYDLTRVREDEVDQQVLDVALGLYEQGNEIIVMSGRSEVARNDTVLWLEDHLGSIGIEYVGPFMRKAGDQRPDFVVKAELFDEHVRDHYNVHGAADDRDQIVNLWRGMGIKCLQVAEGNF